MWTKRDLKKREGISKTFYLIKRGQLFKNWMYSYNTLMGHIYLYDIRYGFNL